MSNPYEMTSPNFSLNVQRGDYEQVTTHSTYEVPRPQPSPLGKGGNMNTANTGAQMGAEDGYINGDEVLQSAKPKAKLSGSNNSIYEHIPGEENQTEF